MTPSTLARLLLRRWYVALLGLLLTAALAVGAFRVVEPEYDAAGSILLLPPAEPGANPYLDLAAVPGVPEVISRVLHDSKYADKYAEQGIEDYEVTPDQSAGGPAVLVIGKGTTEDQALEAMVTVMADVLPVLNELQVDAGVDRPNLISGRQIYVETEATKVGKAQTRALIAAGGAGLVLTLFLVAAIDALLRRREERRARRSAEKRGAGRPPGGDTPDVARRLDGDPEAGLGSSGPAATVGAASRNGSPGRPAKNAAKGSKSRMTTPGSTLRARGK